MEALRMTQTQRDEVLDVLDRWADTLVGYDDRQCFGALYQEIDGKVHMCAQGALDVAIRGGMPDKTPSGYEALMHYKSYFFMHENPFVMDLVARTAARQNGVDISPEKVEGRGYYRLIPYLNDVEQITLLQFACAIRHTRLMVQELAEIVAEEPAKEEVTA